MCKSLGLKGFAVKRALKIKYFDLKCAATPGIFFPFNLRWLPRVFTNKNCTDWCELHEVEALLSRFQVFVDEIFKLRLTMPRNF